MVSAESSDYVLDLMGEVSSDTWGLGSAGLPADGQFATGESMATTIAQWLAKQAPRYARTPSGC